MVISNEHKYLFIELFRTGSTAISSELCELYDGKKILNKHSRYHEFLKIATDEEKKYFVFSSIRNPMDTVVSGYLKLKTNHKQRYTTPGEWRRNGGIITDKNLKLYKDVTDNNLTFEQYFRKYFKLPYDNWSSSTHKHLDFVLRFEHLQEDFIKVLQTLNIKPARPIPVINKTSNKENFIKYYTPEIRERAIFIFGPFMKKWGYSFPQEWGVKNNNPVSFALFSLAGTLKKAYWKNTKTVSLGA